MKAGAVAAAAVRAAVTAEAVVAAVAPIRVMILECNTSLLTIAIRGVSAATFNSDRDLRLSFRMAVAHTLLVDVQKIFNVLASDAAGRRLSETDSCKVSYDILADDQGELTSIKRGVTSKLGCALCSKSFTTEMRKPFPRTTSRAWLGTK